MKEKMIFALLTVIAVFLLSIVTVSCNKDSLLSSEQPIVNQNSLAHESSEYPLGTASVTYGVTPSVGSFTPNSSSSVTLPGISGCGSFMGGVLKAKVKSQSGNSFVVEISKQDGTNFGTGTAYVKAGSVCGGNAGSISVVSGTPNTLDITISASFSQGVVHFYPVFISTSGGRYYAEPLMVYTVPTYTMSLTNGTIMGTVDGIEVRSSGAGNENLSSYYQCTEFCKRYYASVYALSISGWGDATDWMGNYDNTKFEKQTQGSINPRVGDILCFGGGTTSSSKPGGYGHVAIITEVSSTEVKFAHQNGGTGGYLNAFIPIGGRVSRSSGSLYMISPTTTLYVQGIIRKKP